MPKQKKLVVCPHCGSDGKPTNVYLMRCVNYTECGRYF